MPFRDAWLIVGPLLAIIGVGVGEPLITGLGLLIVVVGALARYWHKYLFDRVVLTPRLRETRTFQDEEVTLEVTLENGKLLPMPWFEWRVSVAEALASPGEHLAPSSSPGRNWISRRGALGWFERQRWTFPLHATERGYHSIGPAEVGSGDLLGLFPGQMRDSTLQHLIAYPRIFALEDLGLPADHLLGDRKGRNRLFQDPLRISGLRDYQPGDPLKRIDWKATARRGELQSRVYEPSAVEQLYLLMNIDTLERSWEGYLSDELERTVSVAASVATWASEKKFAVGLIANGSFPGSDRPIRLLPSRSRDQLSRILESLAVVQPLTLSDLASAIYRQPTGRAEANASRRRDDDMLAAAVHRESPRIPAGSTMVLIAAFIPDALRAAMQRLHEEGHLVVVIATSDRANVTGLDGITVHSVTRDFERQEAVR